MIRLSNGQYNGGPDYSKGVPAAVPRAHCLLSAAAGLYMTYFAEGSTAIPDPSTWTSSSDDAAAGLA